MKTIKRFRTKFSYGNYLMNEEEWDERFERFYTDEVRTFFPRALFKPRMMVINDVDFSLS